MARNKRTKFKAYRKDMSNGGRVSYAEGDRVKKDTPLKKAIKNKPSSSRGEQEYNQVKNIKTPGVKTNEPVVLEQQNVPLTTKPVGEVKPAPTPAPTP
jgi:hypothetical protein